MADDQTVLEYIIRAQDQAKGLLQQQVQLLEKMSAGVATLANAQAAQTQRAQQAAQAAAAQGDSLDKLIRLYNQLEQATQRTVRGFTAMSASLQQGGKLTLVQSQWLNDLNKAVQSNSGFMSQNGNAWNSLMGQMKVGTQLTPQLTNQFNTLGQAFQTTASGGAVTGVTLQNIRAASVAASAALGGLAATITGSLVKGMDDSVKQASLFQNTFLGLSSVAKAFGQNIDDATSEAKKLASDGLISVRDAALTLKNLMAAGFNLDQAVNLAKGFKDISAFNRQASMDMGYAMTSASEGIKNQNSLLVDNAGLTKNLTIILKEMGLSEQDLAKVQTDVNIRTKLYTGLLKEMGMASGDAQRYTQTFSGAQSKLQVQIQLLEVAIGDRLLPMLTKLMNLFSGTVEVLRNGNGPWAETARIVVTVTTAFLAVSAAMVALLGTLGAIAGALTLLNPALVAMGLTLGGVLTGVGAVAGTIALVITGFITWKRHMDAAGDSADRAKLSALGYTGSLKEMVDQLNNNENGVRKNTSAWEDFETIVSRKFSSVVDSVKTGMQRIKEGLEQDMEDFRRWGREFSELPWVKAAAQKADELAKAAKKSLHDMATPTDEENRAAAQVLYNLTAQKEATDEMAAADRAALEVKKQREAVERRFGELIKGQVIDQKTYGEAAKKLQADIDLLVSKGMNRDAAMRLPEIVKEAKELASSAREGVAPMNSLADAIVKRGEALEHQRRLEQEALEHTREYENRLRLLNRAFVDQTTGVDSLSGKMKLLDASMQHSGVTFDSGIDKLKPFQQLMQEIVNQVETMGDKAPAGFDKLRAALLKLPGGESPIAKLQAENMEYTKKMIAEQSKIYVQGFDRQIEMAKKTAESLRQIHIKTAAEEERLQDDSLEKRLSAARRSYDEELQSVTHFNEGGQAQLTSLNEWWNATTRNIQKEWDEHLIEMNNNTQTFGKQFMAIFRTIPATIAQAFTGGGGFSGAFKSIASQLGSFFGEKGGLNIGQKLLNNMSEVGGKLGSMIGTFAGPIGAAIGSMVGPMVGKIVGLFKKPEYKKIMNDVGKDWGGELSEGLAQQIADFAKQNKVSRQLAEVLNINEILGEQGGLNAQNYQKFTSQAMKLFDVIAKGGKTGQKAMEELNGFFSSMVTNMNSQMHGLADGAMLDFIKRAKQSGQEIQAVTDFLNQMTDAAAEGLNKVVAGIVGQSVTNYDKLNDLVDKTLPDLLQKQDELQEKISKEKDPVALHKLNMELERTQEALQKAFDEADRLSGGLTKFVADGQEGFDRTGRLIAATFSAGLAQGKSFLQMLDAIGPSLDIMKKAAEQFGFTMSDSLQNLLNLRDVINNNRELADSIDGLNQLMKSLNNLGAMNQDTFNDLGDTAADMFQKLKDAGVSGDDALKLMQPSLQTLWELQQRFGYQVDEATQKLLDQAVAAGTVGKAHMSAQERMVAGIDKLIGRFDLLLKKFGVDVPQDADDAGSAMKSAVEDAQTPTDDLNSKLETTAQRYREARDAAREFAQVAVDGQTGVVYGNSPGGLIDIQAKLEELKRQWKDTGTIAAGSLEATQKQVDALNDVMHNLSRATMSDNARELDDIDQRRQQSIASFVKEMEGAAQELIDAGIAAINKTAEIETSQAVWAQRNKAINEAVALAQKWADTLKDVQRQLELDQTTSPLQRQLMELADQRDNAIKTFLQDMVGAAQSQIDAGLAALGQLYERQAQKIKDQIASQQADTLDELRNQVALMKETDPLAKGMLQLQQDKQKQIKDFLTTMVDASQAQIDEGLALIDELFSMKLAELQQSVVNKQPTAAGNSASIPGGGSGTVGWSMDSIMEADRGVSPGAIAQAIQIGLGDAVVLPSQLVIQLPIGRELKSYVIDLHKYANRNSLAPVQANTVVERLS